jgi:hypothetical protein
MVGSIYSSEVKTSTNGKLSSCDYASKEKETKKFTSDWIDDGRDGKHSVDTVNQCWRNLVWGLRVATSFGRAFMNHYQKKMLVGDVIYIESTSGCHSTRDGHCVCDQAIWMPNPMFPLQGDVHERTGCKMWRFMIWTLQRQESTRREGIASMMGQIMKQEDGITKLGRRSTSC